MRYEATVRAGHLNCGRCSTYARKGGKTMSADSRLLVQAVREGINREHLLLNDVGGQLGWSRDKTKNVFSGRTKLSGDDVLDILSNPNVPIPDFRRYRVFLRIRQALLAPAEGYE